MIYQALGDDAFLRVKRDGYFSDDDLEILRDHFRDQVDDDGNITVTFTWEEFETAFKNMPDVH